MLMRIGHALVAAMLLAACASEAPSSGSARDGRWVGYFESSLGPLGCPARGPLDVGIKAGVVSGEALGKGFVMSVSGALDADGALRDGLFRRDDRAAAVVTGTFLDEDAAGRWQGASCEGVWILRRIS